MQQQFSEGVDRLRQTAKWIIAVFAAIGATLTAGTQLSNIGQFELKDWRLWIAVIAAAVAFLAIGRVIWSAVGVLTGGRTSIDELVEEMKKPASDDKTFVQAHPQLLAGFPNVEALRNDYIETITNREEAGRNNQQQRFQELNGRLIYLQDVIYALLLKPVEAVECPGTFGHKVFSPLGKQAQHLRGGLVIYGRQPLVARGGQRGASGAVVGEVVEGKTIVVTP